MNKGQLIISLDTELAWGRINDPDLKKFIPLIQNTKEVIERLIFCFEKYKIPTTWAIVGKLIEKKIDLDNITYFYPSLTGEKIYKDHILNGSNSLVHAPWILAKIRDSKIKHEIAFHSYSHITFGNTSEANIAYMDIKEGVRAFQEWGIEIKSFVFPRNSINHKSALVKYGISNYRGADRFWYETFPNNFKRIFYQIDTFLAFAPSTNLPVLEDNGLINIAGSMLFRIPNRGLKKYVPFSSLSLKAIKGLESAVNKKEIFHLWFHPFNFAYKSEKHFKALEQVLIKAAQLRDMGNIDILTMEESAKKYLNERR